MTRCESTPQKESEPKSGINILIFDLDGTLIDTMGKHVLVFADYMNAYYGIEPAKSAKHYIDTAGKPTSEQISTLLGKQAEEKSIILGQLIDKDLEQIEPTPFKNTEEILKMFKLRGYRISVSSSHQTEAVGRILKKTGLLKFVDHYVGTDPNDPEFKKGMPHFNELARRYDITFEELARRTVFIGDGDSDMNIAKTCKMPGIGKIGTKDKESLEKSGAWLTFSDFKDLPKKLNKLSDLLKRPVKDVHQEKILVIGTFSKSDVITGFSEGNEKEPKEMKDKVEALWQEKLKQGFYNGKLAGLKSFRLDEGKLILDFESTDFKEYVGTRDFETLREYGIDLIANPTSTNSAVITADRKLIIGEKKTGDGLGSLDAPGGYIDPEKDLEENGNIDIFKAAKREVIEELGLKNEELDEGLCLSLSYEYAGLCHPVLSFIFKSPLTSQEILERKGEEMDISAFDLERDENSEAYFIDLLKKNYQNVEPDGRTTIALARQYLRGRNLEKRIIRTKYQI